MTMPDEDLSPLEPPEALIGIPVTAVAAGYEVVKMPCVNPAFSPILDIAGYEGLGWNVRVRDAFGTIVFSVLLKGVEPDG